MEKETSSEPPVEAKLDAKLPTNAPISYLSALGGYGTLLTPITLALTGLLYLTGWAERNAELASLGLSSAAFSESFQVTLARGYGPLVTGLIGIGSIALLLWFFDRLHQPMRNSVAALPPTIQPLMSRLLSINRINIILIFTLVVMGSGLIVGGIVGRQKCARVIAIVQAGCLEKCFVYRLGKRTLTGRIVAQDNNLTAIYTRGGLHLVATNAITTVRAATGAHPSVPSLNFERWFDGDDV